MTNATVENQTTAENQATAPPSEYQLAAGVAKHVDLKQIWATQLSSGLKIPTREASELLQSGKAHARVDWNPSFHLDEAALTINVRAEYRIRLSSEEEEPPREIGELAAVYELEYKLDGLPPEKESWQPLFKAFAAVNGMYNSWSYLREYVQSTFARMGLPPFILPLFKPQLSSGWQASISNVLNTSATASTAQ